METSAIGNDFKRSLEIANIERPLYFTWGIAWGWGEQEISKLYRLVEEKRINIKTN